MSNNFFNTQFFPQPMEDVIETPSLGFEGFFKPQDTEKMLELVDQLCVINVKLVNWDYISKLKLTNTQYDKYKENLNWTIVSKKISLDSVKYFMEYIDWDIFCEYQKRKALKELTLKLESIKLTN